MEFSNLKKDTEEKESLGAFTDLILFEINKLNHITLPEYVSIVSSFICSTNELYNYGLKDPNDALSKREKKKIELMHIRTGKHKISKDVLLTVEDLEYYTCPSNFYNYNFNYWLDLEKRYEKFGECPFNGKYSEQPNKVIQLFKLIRRMITDKEIDDMKKQQDKMRQQYTR